MNVLNALQNDHDVTLLTLTRPDGSELNRHFETTVDDVAVRRPRVVGRALASVDDPPATLEGALLNRFVAREAGGFDLIVGTDDELDPGVPSVQYVHAPRFARGVVATRVDQDGFLDHVVDHLSYRLAGIDPADVRRSRLLAASERVATDVHDVYGVSPEIVHPPVATDGSDPVPWDEREDGFVAVSRRDDPGPVRRAIRIVDGVRDRGHDVHLHAVGPNLDGARADLKSLAAEREYVRLEGELSRGELLGLLRNHRYGLPGAGRDHAGTAAVEFIAAGSVPFLRADAPGSRVVGDADLRYHSLSGAVETIDAVLSAPDAGRSLRRDPGAVEHRFGRERFRKRIREVVAETLDADRNPPAPEPHPV